MSPRLRLPLIVAGLFVLLAAVAGIGNSLLTSHNAKVQHQLDALADSAQAAMLRAESDSANAAIARQRATEAERRVDSIKALKVHPRLAEIRLAAARSAAAVAVAPDTCAPVIAALQAEVGAQAALAEGWHDTYNAEFEAHAETKAALSQAAVDLGEAHRAFAQLQAKAGSIEVPTGRRSLFTRILPKTSVGCTVGLDPATLKPSKTCGASIGWEVTL